MLEFKGGSIKNTTGNSYSVTGTKTKINSEVAYNIFNDVLGGGFEFPYIDLRWVGGVSDYDEENKSGADNSVAFQRAINAIGEYYDGLYIFLVGKYFINTPITTPYDINIRGSHNCSRNASFDIDTDWKSNTSPSMIAVGSITAFTMEGRNIEGGSTKFAYINLHNIKVVGTSKTNSVFINYTAGGQPTRVCVIDECEFTYLSKCLNIYGTLNTVIGNLTVAKCLVHNVSKFIEADSDTDAHLTVCNLAIKDSNIEQNGVNCITIRKAFGPIIIDNCILEGQESPILITDTIGPVQITNNYLEAVTETAIKVTSSGNNTLQIKNNYVEPSETIKVEISGCIVESDYYRFSDSSAFANCMICGEENFFKLSWIKDKCVCSFEDFTFGDMRGNAVDSTALTAIKNNIVGTVLTSSLADLFYYPGAAAGDYYLAVYAEKSAFVNGGITGETNRGFLLRKGLNIFKFTISSSGDFDFYLKGGNVFISRPVVLDSDDYKSPLILSTSNIYLANPANLSNITKPLGMKAFYQKPLYWDGSQWVDATGTPV